MNNATSGAYGKHGGDKRYVKNFARET